MELIQELVNRQDKVHHLYLVVVMLQVGVLVIQLREDYHLETNLKLEEEAVVVYLVIKAKHQIMQLVVVVLPDRQNQPMEECLAQIKHLLLLPSEEPRQILELEVVVEASLQLLDPNHPLKEVELLETITSLQDLLVLLVKELANLRRAETKNCLVMLQNWVKEVFQKMLVQYYVVAQRKVRKTKLLKISLESQRLQQMQAS